MLRIARTSLIAATVALSLGSAAFAQSMTPATKAAAKSPQSAGIKPGLKEVKPSTASANANFASEKQAVLAKSGAQDIKAGAPAHAPAPANVKPQ